jgi:hypothetical protein
MMFVGSKGKILAGFFLEEPHLIPESRMPKDWVAPVPVRQGDREGAVPAGMRQWIAAVRGGPQPPSSFLNAGPISEAVNLYAIALRTGKKLLYDAESRKITNLEAANKYLFREYRKGWEPQSI